MAFVLSSFLDNIAAALIGATMAKIVFPTVHIGYLAAIVAASNAGGAGSVVGDTTTTMMWIDGVSPLDVIHAYVAAVPALLVCGWFASRQQHAHAPMRPASLEAHPDRLGPPRRRRGAARRGAGRQHRRERDGAGRWPTPSRCSASRCGRRMLVTAAVPPARLVGAARGRDRLGVPAVAGAGGVDDAGGTAAGGVVAVTAFGLGFVSAVFDNIPLTALALRQGGYDWGMLAYAVGYGGSMIWFGSSAGVAVTNVFPEAKSVAQWLRHGWHVALAYVVGFAILLAALGWQPHAPHREPAAATPAAHE